MAHTWPIVVALALHLSVGTGARAESLLATAPCTPDAAAAASGSVEAIDARSIRLADGRVLRLAGIEPFSLLRNDAATDVEAGLMVRLSALLPVDGLRFQTVDEAPDRYGRLLALIWADKTLIQETLTREGMAIAFADGASLPCFDRILSAEDAGRRARRGYWKDERLPWAAAPTALAPRIGHFAIVEGRVISVGNRPNRSFLDFGRRWSEDMTAEVAAANRQAFGGEQALSALVGRRVRIRGFLEQRSGPMLTLRSPAELEVLDPAK